MLWQQLTKIMSGQNLWAAGATISSKAALIALSPASPVHAVLSRQDMGRTWAEHVLTRHGQKTVKNKKCCLRTASGRAADKQPCLPCRLQRNLPSSVTNTAKETALSDSSKRNAFMKQAWHMKSSTEPSAMQVTTHIISMASNHSGVHFQYSSRLTRCMAV